MSSVVSGRERSCRRLVIFLFRVGLATDSLVGSAVGAGTFDGTYTGTVVLSESSNPKCIWKGSIPTTITPDSITVINNHFDHDIREMPISIDISPDGSFEGHTVLRNMYGTWPLHIVGKITGDVLRASVPGNRCDFTLTLKKRVIVLPSSRVTGDREVSALAGTNPFLRSAALPNPPAP
jgi:hypothetical protein